MKTEARVVEMIKDLGCKEEVCLTDRLQNDIMFDSLMMVALLVEIEDGFGIELHETDMNPFDLQTVEDVVNLVEKYVGDGDEEKS